MGEVGPDRRRIRSDGADVRLASLFNAALATVGHTYGSPSGFALVAVGGYGRRELAPASDLDVVLVHADRRAGQPGREVTVARLAELLWYPLWDDGVRLDHAVRTVHDARTAAAADLRTALSLLDVRHLAGEKSLTTELRTSVLADWRGSARYRLPELRASVAARAGRFGELAHAQAGDLKQARGGLRDLVVLDALVASWLIDLPHRRVDSARRVLLDVRDALHTVTGRAGDRLGPDDQPDVAAVLGLSGRTDLLRTVSGAARTVALVADVAWRRVDTLLADPGDAGPGGSGPGGSGPGGAARRRERPGPRLVPRADGVAVHDGEVVLTADARPGTDPDLVLRVAAVAAHAGDPVAPATLDRLARDAAVPGTPWPDGARRHLLEALGAGPGLVGVWETYDEAGLLNRLLPVWAEIRCLPSSSPVHTWTVDRHSIGAVVAAAGLVRRVARPDLLLLAALLHDLGKGPAARTGADHALAGAPMAHRVAVDLGLPPADADTLALLVRLHLLLAETATTRDVEDPSTAAAVAARLPDAGTLDLLAALTEADARATGPAAWSPWRARLVGRLADRVRDLMVGSVPTGADPVDITVRLGELGLTGWTPGGSVPAVVATGSDGDTHHLTTVAPDRPGLLALLAGVLALDRLVVRSAAVAGAGGVAVVDWVLTRSAAEPPDPARLRAGLVRALAGTLDPAVGLASRDAGLASGGAGAVPGRPGEVAVLAGASRSATVLQVRATDRPGLLFAVCSALTAAGAEVRSAHLATFGGEVVDAFYLPGPAGGPLLDGAAERVRAAVAAAVG